MIYIDLIVELYLHDNCLCQILLKLNNNKKSNNLCFNIYIYIFT